ncbi:MAG: hypothetical protein JWM39_672 [Parcubacteria group bacterium]|nr:hypothetical protein [Parcubacteria group bacterium]
MKVFSFLTEVFVRALPALVGITLLAGVAYVNDQQTWRMMANEPQEWIAQNAANTAAQQTSAPVAPIDTITGTNTPVLNPTPEDAAPLPATAQGSQTHIAIERDEAPYTILYNAKRDAVSGTGYLHGVLPQLPSGIFDAAAKAGVNRLTWQPEPGVRQAIVVLPITGGPLTGGFVVAGRSLAYTEWQESQLTQRWILGWLASAIGILIISAIIAFLHLRRRTAPTPV